MDKNFEMSWLKISFMDQKMELSFMSFKKIQKNRLRMRFYK